MRLRTVKHMDKLEKRLKDDANRIEAKLSPQMQERIRASLESTLPERPLPAGKRTPGVTLWWASSLSGLAAVAVIIAIVNWNSTVEPVQNVPPDWRMHSPFPLKTETAEWTAPLEEELKKLQADLEKARENVERDLKMSF